jgi:hypothetical protein
VKNASCKRLGLIAVTVFVASCSSTTTAPPQRRAPSTLSSIERIAVGSHTALQDAQLFVPDGFQPDPAGSVPLYLHFQGGVTIAEENFARMQKPGVLIASTLKGFSSAFSRPYENPAAFRDLIHAAEQRLSTQFERDLRFDPVVITFFSAGYGAVRELLKQPEFFERIDSLVSADSIYASVVHDDVRAPQAEQMIDFMRFAQAAARGEKTFVLAHGMYATEYASTSECADMILASVAGQRSESQDVTARGVPISSEYHHGGMHLYTFDEATAGFHVDCLYMIPDLVRRHLPH